MKSHRSEAERHAKIANEQLDGVGSRRDEGPAFGAVKAQSATAHALLALYHCQRMKEED